MFRIAVNVLAACGLIAITGSLAACFNDSDADSSDVDLTEINQRLAELEAKVAADRVYSVGSTASAKVGALAAAETVIDQGQFMGYGNSAHSTPYATVTSAQGFLAVVPIGVSGDVYLEPLPSVTMYFSGTGCTGDAYLSEHHFSESAKASGVVFSVSRNATPEYFALTPSAADVSDAAYLSRMFVPDAICEEEAGTLTGVSWVAAANDPAVTGWANEPMTGPVRIGTVN